MRHGEWSSTLQGQAVPVDEASDLDLVTAARAGDSRAFAQLWHRHRSAGLATARGYRNLAEPDDLVAEAFVRTYSAILSGGGPSDTFRGYLLSTIRRLALSAGRKGERTFTTDDLEGLEVADSAEWAAMRNLDHGVVARAFQSLPIRWREVLWHSVVEGTSHSEIARRLKTTSNAVDQLAHRAREGLRQTWIQEQVQLTKTVPACRWATSRVGAAARGKLPRRDSTRLQEHLEGCSGCAIVMEEAHRIAERFV